MTASQTAKAAGLASLKELAEMSKQSSQTLTNWHNNKPELFDLVVKGAVMRKKCREIVQFTMSVAPYDPIAVTPHYLCVGPLKYSHKDFLMGHINLIEADSQRVRKALDQFYIFAGDV